MSRHLSAYIRTRRKGTVECDACWLYIRVGDRYHVDTYVFDSTIYRRHAHVECDAEALLSGYGGSEYTDGYLADDDLCDRSAEYVAWFDARKAEQVGE